MIYRSKATAKLVHTKNCNIVKREGDVDYTYGM